MLFLFFTSSLMLIPGQKNDDPVLFEKLLWLSNNSQPWSKVLDVWKETAKGRLDKYYSSKQSIQSYFDTYPALKDKSGFYLVS